MKQTTGKGDFIPLDLCDQDPAPRCRSYEALAEKPCSQCGTMTKDRSWGEIICHCCHTFQFPPAVHQYLEQIAILWFQMKSHLNPLIRTLTGKQAQFICAILDRYKLQPPKQFLLRAMIRKCLRWEGLNRISAAAVSIIQRQLKP
jgi:hypothetical protein